MSYIRKYAVSNLSILMLMLSDAIYRWLSFFALHGKISFDYLKPKKQAKPTKERT